MNEQDIVDRIKRASSNERLEMLEVDSNSDLNFLRSENFVDYYVCGELSGFSIMDISSFGGKILYFNFFPFINKPKLNGSGLGSLTFMLNLIEGYQTFGVTEDYKIEIPSKMMSPKFKQMLGRVGLYDQLEKVNPISHRVVTGTYEIRYGEFFDKFLEGLRSKGYSFEKYGY